MASTTTALDADRCYAAVRSRDRRWDGVFWTGVRTTGIYCRPSCPARTPAAHNVTFHQSAAAAQAAGFRACKRCLPDATPGSPEWNVAATAAGRAMRLIADGVVDREGVAGLADRMGYSPRHLTRILGAELGAGPLALARAQRAQTARVLVESTDLPFAEIAFAAGFASIRQFNDTLRAVYEATPTALRDRRGSRTSAGTISLRVAVRTPFAGRCLRDFLAARAVPGVEVVRGEEYARTVHLPRGPGTISLRLRDEHDAGTAVVPVTLALHDLRDTAAALARARRLLDADADPLPIADHLGRDATLAPLVTRRPGLRVPGQVAGAEVAVRAILGQQVSVASARTVAGRLVAEHGRVHDGGEPGLTHLFPDAATVAGIDPATLPMPGARGRALVGAMAAVAAGAIDLDGASPRDDVRRALLDLPGVGPWTADYIALRALGDPDVFLSTDVGVRHALRTRPDADPQRWAPWRSYALLHLWTSLEED
ncbi:helix-turn-helix domain-containing protein [Nocardioides panacisoli]|uniref:AlkA N-terminal domain-containing protein n=1 Tax=Nocardioides panacisoli TaxID=627624 RepID=UPI001C62C61B|nr:AlkA N-terminal domain-containing protein [Nocardioides panacisoli]QYJ04537.1 helix-turn-helix domain-containing protein [Nocardioides panacisoli]